MKNKNRNAYTLQNQRHALLENFLNGYTLDHASKAAFPLLDTQKIGREKMPAKKAAQILAEMFCKDAPAAQHEQHVQTQTWQKWKRKNKPATLDAFMLRILGEFEKIENHLVGAYVHGSLSDLKITAYSDVDLLAILRQTTVTNPELLLSTRKSFFRVNKLMRLWDPLQHHGVFVVAEKDLDAYCQTWLPLDAIRAATQLVGKSKLAFRVRDNKLEACETLKAHVEYLKRLVHTRDAYHFKEMCSIVMLIPALVLGQRGTFVYKPDSFALAKPLFKKESWKAITMATEIRKKWDKKLWWTPLTFAWPTFWASTATAMTQTIPENNEFKNAVQTLLKDPVIQT